MVDTVECAIAVRMEEDNGRRRQRPPRRRPDVRPGPRTREAERTAQLEEHRRRARDRQRLSRATRNFANLYGEGRPLPPTVSAEGNGGNADQSLYRSTINRHADRISEGVIRQLLRVENVHLRAAVMHKVFTTTHVRPLLPDYYPAPGDAQVERRILENIRAELQRTKIPHNSGKLARKRAILEAVVSEIEADFTRFHLILGTKKKNVVGAVDRIRDATVNSEARFVVPRRRKRQGGIPEDVKAAVSAWWTDETRVSPKQEGHQTKACRAQFV